MYDAYATASSYTRIFKTFLVFHYTYTYNLFNIDAQLHSARI